MFTLSNIKIKIPTKVSSVHFNNLKISQLQRHLHGEGKKWVGQSRQNENARQIVISFFLCVITDWLLLLLLLLYIHSISRLTTTIATTTTTIITLFLIDCVCGSLKDYYDLLALFVRANKFESENACVRVCVCARGTRLPYIF